MAKYDVVVLPFPYDDLSGQKVRPALILTPSRTPMRQVTLAFITSRIDFTLLETDLILNRNTPGFQYTGLPKESVVRLHHLNTLKDFIISRRIGRLTPDLTEEVKTKLNLVFDLA